MYRHVWLQFNVNDWPIRPHKRARGMWRQFRILEHAKIYPQTYYYDHAWMDYIIDVTLQKIPLVQGICGL